MDISNLAKIWVINEDNTDIFILNLYLGFHEGVYGHL